MLGTSCPRVTNGTLLPPKRTTPPPCKFDIDAKSISLDEQLRMGMMSVNWQNLENQQFEQFGTQ
jgi:hypothetical protein